MRFLALIFMLVPYICFAQDVRTYIPDRANKYLPMMEKQIKEVWPAMPMKNYFPALVEHESCISLKHPKCWNPQSRLKTSREEGAGLSQITRAYRPDGSLRFDALAEARSLDAKGLNDLRWDTIYERPDLQIRVMILMTRANWNRLEPLVANMEGRLAMADAAYNGGLGGLLNERRACSSKPGCDPARWFGHVEQTCLKSKKPLYGDRSACDINRHHVQDVLLNRMPKYRKAINV